MKNRTTVLSSPSFMTSLFFMVTFLPSPALLAAQTGDASGWVSIDPGSFLMGSPESEPCREPYGIQETLHEVTLTRGFEIATTEVTQSQFEAVMGSNPSELLACGSDCPVDSVSWHEAAAYTNALSALSGLEPCYRCTGSGSSLSCRVAPAWRDDFYACPGYRLPTEAEWEYAYRAGSSSAFYNGDIDPRSCEGADPNAERIAWYDQNSSARTWPVGQKEPNAWGLFDMAGNVNEWMHDCYQADLGSSPVTDPVVGLEAGLQRVVRGGSYDGAASYQRAAFRHLGHVPVVRWAVIGFRPVRTLE